MNKDLKKIQNAIGWADTWFTVATGAARLCRYIDKLEKHIEVLEKRIAELEARERLRAEAWNAEILGPDYQEMTT